ncbi:uncharacterized protein [Dysidea avara]|uniref:uncharacterized protein n=1 Tax=Dysidea avara TaxID=196820 RepID=UPI003319EE47
MAGSATRNLDRKKDTHALVEVIKPGSPTSVVAVWRIVETHKDIMYDSQCTVLWEDKKEYDCILLFSGSKKRCLEYQEEVEEYQNDEEYQDDEGFKDEEGQDEKEYQDKENCREEHNDFDKLSTPPTAKKLKMGTEKGKSLKKNAGKTKGSGESKSSKKDAGGKTKGSGESKSSKKDAGGKTKDDGFIIHIGTAAPSEPPEHIEKSQPKAPAEVYNEKGNAIENYTEESNAEDDFNHQFVEKPPYRVTVDDGPADRSSLPKHMMYREQQEQF